MSDDITAETAANKAAEALEAATNGSSQGFSPETVHGLVAIADAWTRLSATLRAPTVGYSETEG